MSEDIERYLKSEDEGYIRITPKIQDLADEITEGAKTDAEKAEKIYDYVRKVDYFISPATRSEDLIDRTSLDCGAKHTLLASLNRAAGIPTKIKLMACPMEGLHSTVDHLGLPEWITMVGHTALHMAEENAIGGTHYATEAYYDDDWHFMDATLNDRLCDYFDGDKKERCLSKQNASGLLDCRPIGEAEDMPSNGILLSSMARMITDFTGVTSQVKNITKKRSENLLAMEDKVLEELEKQL